MLAKLEEEDSSEDKKGEKKPVEAHVTSLSVLRTHRKLGIATKLMRASHRQMKNVFQCDSCTLRVRVTNRAAFTLYKTVLGYTVRDVDKSYYADGEDAYDMQLKFTDTDEESKAGEENPEAGKAFDQYAESNPKAPTLLKAKKTTATEEAKESDAETEASAGSKAAKNKKKREKAKAAAAAKKVAETETAN